MIWASMTYNTHKFTLMPIQHFVLIFNVICVALIFRISQMTFIILNQ